MWGRAKHDCQRLGGDVCFSITRREIRTLFVQRAACCVHRCYVVPVDYREALTLRNALVVNRTQRRALLVAWAARDRVAYERILDNARREHMQL